MQGTIYQGQSPLLHAQVEERYNKIRHSLIDLFRDLAETRKSKESYMLRHRERESTVQYPTTCIAAAT